GDRDACLKAQVPSRKFCGGGVVAETPPPGHPPRSASDPLACTVPVRRGRPPAESAAPEPPKAPRPGPSDLTPEPVFDDGPRCLRCGRRPVRPNAGGLCPSCNFLRSVEANRDNPAGA